MDKEKLFNLATRLNEIRIEQNKLDIEYNQIIEELWNMIPKLKDDPNIQPKTLVKRG